VRCEGVFSFYIALDHLRDWCAVSWVCGVWCVVCRGGRKGNGGRGGNEREAGGKGTGNGSSLVFAQRCGVSSSLYEWNADYPVTI
jgi:hypothetical protein